MAEDGSGWSRKSDMERAIIAGLYGAPEVRKEERKHFLGELQERVLASATKAQVKGAAVIKQVTAAVKDPRAKALIVHGDIPFEDALKYVRLAQEHHVAFTKRSDPAFKGEIGLVVVSAK